MGWFADWIDLEELDHDDIKVKIFIKSLLERQEYGSPVFQKDPSQAIKLWRMPSRKGGKKGRTPGGDCLSSIPLGGNRVSLSRNSLTDS